MPFREFPCYICSGLKYIYIGRNLDGVKLETVDCPGCNAKGHLHVDYKFNLDSPTFKRLMGLDQSWEQLN